MKLEKWFEVIAVCGFSAMVTFVLSMAAIGFVMAYKIATGPSP